MSVYEPRVTDSVQQIAGACKELLEIASEYPNYYDVSLHASKVRDELARLTAMFDKHPERTMEIKGIKYNVERAGLELEYYIVVRCHRLVERYNRRIEANRLYSELRDRVFDPRVDKNVLLQYNDYLQWSLDYWERSKHLLFEIDEADERKLQNVMEVFSACK